MAIRYWLMKTEPDVFSFDDLVKAPKMTAEWEGVRNYQARNFMRDQFQLADKVLIYHSRIEEPGVYGTAKVVRTAYPDPTALDKKSPYFDGKSAAAGESRWCMVDVCAEKRFRQPVTLGMIRETNGLEKMLVIKKGMRLSIQPVQKGEWDILMRLGKPGSVKG